MKKCSLLVIILSMTCGLAWPLQVEGADGRDERKKRSEARRNGTEKSRIAPTPEPKQKRQRGNRTSSRFSQVISNKPKP